MSENYVGQDEAQWYVVHTYSGYEEKVMRDLLKLHDNNREYGHMILDARVPQEKVAETKNGKRSLVKQLTYPGYVLVQMVITNETWYLVRNTTGVTGFVGPGSQPIPLSADEVKKMMGETEQQSKIDLEIGDECRILEGLYKDHTGTVTSIDSENLTVHLAIEMMQRKVSLEIGIESIKRIERGSVQ